MDTYEGNVNKIFSLLFYVVLVLASYSLTRIGLVELLNMSFHGIDFCLYDNAIYNAARGTWLHCNLKHSWSYLGTHFSPILFVFAPFYRLGAGPWLLIVVRSLAMVGGAILIRYYGKKFAGLSGIAADIVGISFLLHPMVHMAVLSEFHGMILELFFVPLFFVALGAKRKRLIWVALFLLLSVREDTWLYAAGISVLILWKEDKKLAKQILLVSVAWGVCSLFVAMPFFQRGMGSILQGNAQLSTYLVRYRGYLSRGIAAFIVPRLGADVKLLLPLAFLPLFGGRFFLLLLIPLIQIQMGQIRYQVHLLSHYSSCVIPFAYIAAIHGLKNVRGFFDRRLPGEGFDLRRWGKTVVVLNVLILSFAGLRESVVLKKRFSLIFQEKIIRLRERTAFTILKSIHPEASLSLQGSLLLIGAHRPRVYLFSGYPPKTGYPSRETEYVMVDLGRDFPLVKHYGNVVASLLKSGRYGVKVYRDGFVLLKRGHDPGKNANVLHDIYYRIQGEFMHSLTGKREEGVDYDWKAARVARQGRDGKGGLAFGSHRKLPSGTYKVVFVLLLEGQPGRDAATLVLKGRGGKGRRVLLKKTVKFPPKQGLDKISFRLELKETTAVEPIVFYGGIGTIGLDYIEFNRV